MLPTGGCKRNFIWSLIFLLSFTVSDSDIFSVQLHVSQCVLSQGRPKFIAYELLYVVESSPARSEICDIRLGGSEMWDRA